MKTLEIKRVAKIKKSVVFRRGFKLVLGALLISIASRFFVIYAGIYSSGVSGLAQGISYTIWDIATSDGSKTFLGFTETEFKNTFYWIIYSMMNVFIVIWAYFQFGKKFIGWSVFTFATTVAFSMLFIYSPIFTNTGFIPDWDPEVTPTYINYTISIISASLGALIGGIGLGIIFLEGSSCLGTDPITRYVAREKQISLVGFLFTISIINILIWTTITATINGDIDYSFKNYINNVLFNYTMLSSILYMALYSLTIAWMYPTSRKFLVQITSEKSRQISEYLKEIRFHRGQTLINSEGGYTHHKQKTIFMVINSEEFNDLVQYVSEKDQNAFIIASQVSKIVTGNKNTTWVPVTKEDIKAKEETTKLKKQFYFKSKNKKSNIKKQSSSTKK